MGRRFTETELEELTISLLDILDYLHSLQPPVIHRDIKPSNILLTNRSGNSIGDVYLVDFGSVQNVAAKDGGTMTVVGTYGYMPMEQFGGKTVPASDLYSLGATLIYTISGVHPADLPQEDGKIQLPANNLSPGWRRWLETAIEPSLKHRFSDVKTARLALTRLGEGDLIVREKPYGSKILLTTGQDAIDIIIPDRRLPTLREVMIVSSLFFAMTLLSLPLLGLILVKSGHYLIIGVIFLLVCTTPIGYNLAYYFFGKLHLQIDKDRISCDRTIGEYKFGQEIPSSPVSTIFRLAYRSIPPSSDKNKIAVGSKEIVIFAGAREYRIQSASEAEAEWLAAELSEWLNLPVLKN
jgi:serine/threonine protein kinase